MGALADGALAKGGHVIGVLPEFMGKLEWGHERLTELRLVGDMHERKRRMIAEVDAVIALPGGCGTLEELFEAITWKRLGLYSKPIVLVNVAGYFDPCVELLERAIAESSRSRRRSCPRSRPPQLGPTRRATSPSRKARQAARAARRSRAASGRPALPADNRQELRATSRFPDPAGVQVPQQPSDRAFSDPARAALP
jgi:hypothetical protein